MNEIRIVLADDHDVVRNGIRQLIAREGDLRVVGEARNGLEALAVVEETRPDVLILDIEMPVMNGVEVARRMKEQNSVTRVLVLSAYDDLEYILELLANGANGYLLKENAPLQLISAIRRVARDEREWNAQRVSERLLALRRSMSFQDTITLLELELLRAYAAGGSVEAAARRAAIDVVDVERIFTSMRRRLLARTNTELLGAAVGLGWVSLSTGNE